MKLSAKEKSISVSSTCYWFDEQ